MPFGVDELGVVASLFGSIHRRARKVAVI